MEKMTNEKQKRKKKIELLNWITFEVCFYFFEKSIRITFFLEYCYIQLTRFVCQTNKIFQFLKGLAPQCCLTEKTVVIVERSKHWKNTVKNI